MQTLVGHHSAAFTMDQYAEESPQQLEQAGEAVAKLPLAASSSKTVAPPEAKAAKTAKVIE